MISNRGGDFVSTPGAFYMSLLLSFGVFFAKAEGEEADASSELKERQLAGVTSSFRTIHGVAFDFPEMPVPIRCFDFTRVVLT